MFDAWGAGAQGRELSIKWKRVHRNMIQLRSHRTQCKELPVPGKKMEREQGKVVRKEKEERDDQRERKEESTDFGKRKAAGSGRQRNQAVEMRTEQDGRNRWKEKGEMNIAWGT